MKRLLAQLSAAVAIVALAGATATAAPGAIRITKI